MGQRKYYEGEDIRFILEFGTDLNKQPDHAVLTIYAELLEYAIDQGLEIPSSLWEE